MSTGMSAYDPAPTPHNSPKSVFQNPKVAIALITVIGSVITSIATTAISFLTVARKTAVTIVDEEARKNGIFEPQLPVGAILPYFGSVENLPIGWALCDGANTGQETKVPDADPGPGGKQLPDLRGRFLQGVDAGAPLLGLDNKLQVGGNDAISEDKHAHLWAEYKKNKNVKNWFSYDAVNTEQQVSAWVDGISNASKGEIRALDTHNDKDAALYTKAYIHNHGGDNRPRYAKIHWIIKVK
jgi:hypothetical protein